MAGTIVFHVGDWRVSGGGFRAMVRSVTKQLAENNLGSEVKAVLIHAVDTGLYFIDATQSLPRELREEFLRGVELCYLEEAAMNPADSPSPELHAGFVQRIEELRDILRKSLLPIDDNATG